MEWEGWPWDGDGSGVRTCSGMAQNLLSQPLWSATCQCLKMPLLVTLRSSDQLSVMDVPKGRLPYFTPVPHPPAWEGQAGLIPEIPAMQLEFSGT